MRWPEAHEPPLAIADHLVRRVTPADLAALQTMFERDPGFFVATEGAPPRPDEAAQQIADPPPPPLDDSAKHAFVVHTGETLVAFVDLLVGFPTPTTWYLGLIFLAPTARGCGLGGLLLEAVCAHAAAVDGTAVRLAVVVSNRGARRLYDRHGFQLVHRRKRTTWSGAVVECDVLERMV